MANTCCYCIGLRPGTIIILVLLLFPITLTPFRYKGVRFPVYAYSYGLETFIPTGRVIDVSPQAMDYIFAVFLPVVILAMLLSAIFRKSEILYYALITFIILLISLTVYSSVGKAKGWWFECQLLPTCSYSITEEKIYVLSTPMSYIAAVIRYVLGGYFMFVVYSYVQQLRRGIPTSGQVISA